MKECVDGRCSIGENQNRGKLFKLRCANCGHEEPLTYQHENGIICPKCNNGILIWTPNTTLPKLYYCEQKQVKCNTQPNTNNCLGCPL